MPSEVLFGLPRWLVMGLLLGFLASLGAALAFAVGVRLFPGDRPEARTFGGESRRHTEIRAYLDAIDEPYAEGHLVEGQEVAFYLPERDVAITFDPRHFYRIERSPTDAVLVEHEMPGIALGARLPFETPEISFGDEPDGDGDDLERIDPTRAAFAVLGLPANASVDQVKSAYRRKVKEVHPDHGGDRDEFRRVREAYTTAKKHAS